MIRLAVALFVVVGLVSESQAGWFRLRVRERTRISVVKALVQKDKAIQKDPVQKEPVQKEPVQKAVQKDTPQAVAVMKAERAARLGIRYHQGGSFGGCRYEGIGFSTISAQVALNNCCFTGTRVCVAAHVARGAGGWYAVKLFR